MNGAEVLFGDLMGHCGYPLIRWKDVEMSTEPERLRWFAIDR